MKVAFGTLKKGQCFRPIGRFHDVVYMKAVEGLRDSGGPVNAFILTGQMKGNPEAFEDDSEVEVFEGTLAERSRRTVPVENI